MRSFCRVFGKDITPPARFRYYFRPELSALRKDVNDVPIAWHIVRSSMTSIRRSPFAFADKGLRFLESLCQFGLRYAQTTAFSPQRAQEKLISRS
jgi:hypothetical protein